MKRDYREKIKIITKTTYLSNETVEKLKNFLKKNERWNHFEIAQYNDDLKVDTRIFKLLFTTYCSNYANYTTKNEILHDFFKSHSEFDEYMIDIDDDDHAFVEHQCFYCKKINMFVV